MTLTRRDLENIPVRFPPDAIVQSTSGSSGGKRLLIPRSFADIASQHAIVLGAYLQGYAEGPQRVALLGGVSHGQAALRFEVKGTAFRSFDLADIASLRDFDPEMIACYPSIARELCALDLAFPSLKAVKLGGEPVLRVDLEKIFARFPRVLLIEQLGSTEMPAIAIGVYRTACDPRRLALQTHRYAFRFDDHEDWQPLVVKDQFPGLLLPIPDFYDTQDEVRVKDGFILAIRRKNDPAARYRDWQEALLRQGCTNVQLDSAKKQLRFSGKAPIKTPGGLRLASEAPARLPGSNKLPVVI